MKKYVLDDHAASPQAMGSGPQPQRTSGPPAATWKKDAKHWANFKKYDKLLPLWEKLVVEAYCCGYLLYHEKVVEKGGVEYDILFDWANNNGVSKLDVYIKQL